MHISIDNEYANRINNTSECIVKVANLGYTVMHMSQTNINCDITITMYVKFTSILISNRITVLNKVWNGF